MSQPNTWWIVTDLDGTLMDHSYSWEPAQETLRWLQARQIPVIPCTSKTAEEVRGFRQVAGLRDPFIVENGGAIHGEAASGEEWEEALGIHHSLLRPRLNELEALLGESLLPLEDLSESEGLRLLGLAGEALAQAQRRCWSVPFVPPSAEGRERLPALADALGLSVVQGNRMGHLLGPDVSKGGALARLKQRLGDQRPRVLGLGDSPNDIPLLEASDVAVVVPGPDGPHPAFRRALEQKRYLLAPAPHADGWARMIRQLIA